MNSDHLVLVSLDHTDTVRVFVCWQLTLFKSLLADSSHCSRLCLLAAETAHVFVC